MATVTIKSSGSGTGNFTLEPPTTNTDRTLVLPDEAGTVLTTVSNISSDQLPGVGSLKFNDSFSSPVSAITVDEEFLTGNIYVVYLREITVSTSLAPEFVFRNNGSSITGGDYIRIVEGQDSSGTEFSGNSSGGTESGPVGITTGTTNPGKSFNHILTFYMNSNPIVHITNFYQSDGGGNVRVEHGAVNYRSSTSFDGFRINTSTGNFNSGQIAIYEYPLT